MTSSGTLCPSSRNERRDRITYGVISACASFHHSQYTHQPLQCCIRRIFSRPILVFSRALFRSMIVPIFSERESAITLGNVEEIVCSMHPYGYWRSELIAPTSSVAYEVDRLILTHEVLGSLFSRVLFAIFPINDVPVKISIRREILPTKGVSGIRIVLVTLSRSFHFSRSSTV